jgi:hypothetical protein
MAKFSSKSKNWLDRLETVNRLIKADPNRTGVSLTDELGVSPAHASYLLTLNGCLDQTSIDKIWSRPWNSHSRLDHDVQPGGMPYPTQGVRLSNDCVVEKLWAQSPMANAGVGLGEMIWSVDINAYYPPDRKKLEAALAGLTPGAHNLFLASHSDWDQAQSDVAFHRASSLNPKRRKAVLSI